MDFINKFSLFAQQEPDLDVGRRHTEPGQLLALSFKCHPVQAGQGPYSATIKRG